MKLVLGLLVLLGAGGVVLYLGGGIGSFDPSEQGKKAKAAVGPGMSHTQVFDLCGDPRKVQQIRRDVKKVGSQEIVTFVPSPPTKTTRARMEERVGNDEFTYGFVIPYKFSESVAFAVFFDKTGTVERIQDLQTMSSMLQLGD